MDTRVVVVGGGIAGLVLARALSTRGVPVDDIQRRSRTFGAIAQWQAPLAVWARNTALRHTPERATRRTIERIVSDASDAHGRLR